ncbi:MAG: RluA family pseudouridine synthase [Alphaproteobacteria bacterium]|nr:RluA family pseudouridine synthase [Alphaproteobacteria bacterium]
MSDEKNNIFYTSSVDEKSIGIRIDKFIAGEVEELSRSMVQKLIEGDHIFADEEIIADKDYKTRLGDCYQINIPPLKSPIPVAEDIKLDVLYEDEDLIVVNKPFGMTVHPAAGATRGTLVNALLFHCKDSLSGIGGVARPGIVHRIDRNTSGILVVAKNDFAHKGLAEQFFNHSIERTYFAIVYGVPKETKGTIIGNIARSSFDRKKMALVQNGGKHAVTHYEVIENFKNTVSLIKCNLETGRTHQIRVHLSSIGCHLVGDNVYEKPKKSSVNLPTDLKKMVNEFERQALHAYSLGFIHPKTKEFLSFESDFPDDMKELLNQLRTRF